MKINKSIIYYILFSFLVLGFFLYARFPSKVVENYLLSTMAERYPGTFLSLGSVGLSLPPGLKMKNILFGFKDNPEADIRLDSFKVRPRLLGYLAGHSSFAVGAVAYGGVMTGRTDFPRLRPEKNPNSAEIRIENLTLEKCDYLKETMGRQLSGKLSGVLSYHGASQLDFGIQNGSYQLLESLLGFNRLDFSKLEGRITLKDNLLKVNKLQLKGDKINLSLKGDIVLNPDFKSSAVNLSGTMEVATLNNKKLSMFITGTIGNVQTRYQ